MASWTVFITSILLISVWNRVEAMNDLCPARCQCEDEILRASCVFASLEVVPIQLNPEIKHLDLSNNRIGSLTLAFGFYDNLESLDLSANTLHTLGSDNFLLQLRLITLNVSNNGIRSLSKSSLKGLESLKVLDLSNNNITDMDPSAFRHVGELEMINLNGNSLTSLPENLLANVHTIRTLRLSRNSLLEVPTSNLDLAPSLQDLDLSDNLIQEVSRYSLPSLRSLVSLNLANNVIRNIAEDAFDGLPALLSLDLQGNNLTHVPTNSLSKLNVLSTLNLSRNPLAALEALAFRNLFELKVLDLRQCTIALIHPRTFADNVNLEAIFLDGNRELQHLPSRVLYMARHLKMVSLRHCSLATLEPMYFPLDSLTSLKIAGNPIVCNCSVHWLWSVIHTEERRNLTKLDLDSKEILCSDPEFQGKPLMTLSEGSLRCRLSPLYLTLTALGCLAATATILGLIAYVTRGKRRKRAPFVPTNRPELLVYVGPTSDDVRKPSVAPYTPPRQTVGPNKDFYDFTRGRQQQSPGQPESEALYETPYYGVTGYNMSRGNSGGYNPGTSDIDGVYAVADVTRLREAPPGFLSLYRRDSAGKFNLNPNKYDFEEDHEYRPRPIVSEEKPHVVFV